MAGRPRLKDPERPAIFMTLILRFSIIVICFLTASCTHYYGFKDKKYWSYYPKIGGHSKWRIYRRVWGNMNIANRQIRDNYQRIYQFKENEKVASIGAYMGIQEMLYAVDSPKLDFYLEDIDAKNLNATIFEDIRQKIKTIYPDEIASKFHLVIGDSMKTHLPNEFFHKILIEKSLHEFKYPDEMLKDISQKLSSKGSLFISEQIKDRPGQKSRGCRIYDEKQLIELLKKHGFQLANKYYPSGYYTVSLFMTAEFKKNH